MIRALTVISVLWFWVTLVPMATEKAERYAFAVNTKEPPSCPRSKFCPCTHCQCSECRCGG